MNNMVFRMRSMLYDLTNSIRRKMMLSFLAIIVMLFSASAYTYNSGRALNDLYNNALEKHLLFNEIFVKMGNTNDLLGKYLKADTSDLLASYKKQYTTLMKSSRDLETIMNSGKYVRETVDLKYMIQSYIEEANRAVLMLQKNDLGATSMQYNHAEKTFALVNQSFKEIYSILLNDTNEIKIKVIDNRQKLYTFNGILLALAGLGSLFFTQWFSRSLTKPLQKLTLATSRIADGEMHLAEVGTTTHDEISSLAVSFNKMVHKIEEQITELKEKSELERRFKDEEINNLKIKNLLKNSELKSMQSRINQHFLFNSLNMISQMAYIEDASQTNAMLEAMSDLLRYNLDKFNKIVTMEDEINNLKDYIYIQTMRFGDRICFDVQEAPDAAAAAIPCLTLQPLVENSIIHGVGSYTENGIVKVEIKKEKDRLWISVLDNGLGIMEEKLKILQQQISGDCMDETAECIGLSNVFARLKLYFNGDVEITIRKGKFDGSGTEFVLNIPCRVEGIYDV